MKILDLPQSSELALYRKVKLILKAFVAARYKSMKSEMIFNILPYSAYLFFPFYIF